MNPTRPGIERGRILIVDRDAHCAQLLQTTLERVGHEVLLAGDGVAALARFTEASCRRPLDLIVTDVMLPQMDGLELIARIRREDRDVSILLHTERRDRELLRTALRLGVNDLIEKPLQSLTGIPAINQLIRDSRSHRESSQTVREVRGYCERSLEVDEVQSRRLALISRSLHVAGGDAARIRPSQDGGLEWLVLADVSGHRVSSSYTTATFLTAFEMEVDAVDDLGVLFHLLNEHIHTHRVAFDSNYVCALALRRAPDRQSARLALAGSPPPFLLRHTSSLMERIGTPGPPLGLFHVGEWEEVTLTLAPGDLLVAFTDGLEEARNARGQRFAGQLGARLAAASRTSLAEPVTRNSSVAQQIMEACDSWTENRYHDDVTLAVLDTGVLTPLEAQPRSHGAPATDLKETGNIPVKEDST